MHNMHCCTDTSNTRVKMADFVLIVFINYIFNYYMITIITTNVFTVAIVTN